MDRIKSTTMRRLSRRTMVISGAALGLIAGATVYGAVSSSAQSPAPAAFKAKAPVAAKANLANCVAGAKLDKGVCVVHVVKTVMVPPSAAGVAKPAKAAHAGSSIPSNSVKSGSATRSGGPEIGEAGEKAGDDSAESKCLVVKAGETSEDASRSTSDDAEASRPTVDDTRAPAPIACSTPTPATATPAAPTRVVTTPAPAPVPPAAS